MSLLKLDFGGGIKNDSYPYKTVDITEENNPDFLHDMNVYPYPFEDNSADGILCSHTIEHLDEPEKAIEEFIRIAKPGTVITIRTPHYSHHNAHKGNPQHKHLFNISYIDFFKGFEIILIELHWAIPKEHLYHSPPKYHLSGKYHFVMQNTSRLINSFANKHVRLCERIWCGWVGGFSEIEWRLKKNDNNK